MADNEDLDIGVEEESAPEEEVTQGFSIGLIIEWLLKNLIPIIVAVVLSTIIAVIIVRASVTRRSEEMYQTVRLRPKPPPLAVFHLEDFRVNTADVDEIHFLRVRLSLGYDDVNKKLQQELTDRRVQIRDIILTILNSKEKSDIDEFIERERLKEEIKKAINNVLINGEILDVYYDEFVIS
jgi:flagellar FliL protein